MVKVNLRKILKEKIENVEYFLNGMKHLCGASVDVRIEKIDKKNDKVFATVFLNYDCEGKEETYTGCEYSINKLLNKRG